MLWLPIPPFARGAAQMPWFQRHYRHLLWDSRQAPLLNFQTVRLMEVSVLPLISAPRQVHALIVILRAHNQSSIQG